MRRREASRRGSRVRPEARHRPRGLDPIEETGTEAQLRGQRPDPRAQHLRAEADRRTTKIR